MKTLLRIGCVVCGSMIAIGPTAIALPAQHGIRPIAASAKKLIKITGEFREDGSCQVFADGKPVFAPADSAVTLRIRDAAVGLIGDGIDVHQLVCGKQSLKDSVEGSAASTDLRKPVTPDMRVLTIVLYSPTGSPARARTYNVQPEPPTPQTADRVATVGLLKVVTEKNNESAAVPVGLIYFVGKRGTVEVLRFEKDIVIAKFALVAEATWAL